MRVRQHIPNILTLCNLGCGSLAIIYVAQDMNGLLVLLFGLCLIFDFLDGLAARLLRASSEMGKQLDSFADLVSFGLLPGILMFRYIEHTLLEVSWVVLPFLALLLPFFSAIRLSRFNLNNSSQTKFRGLPTPANALLILSYYFIPIYHPNSFLTPWLKQAFILSGLIILSCFLLVSPLSLLSLKFSEFSLSNNWPRYLLIILGGLGLTFYQFLAIPFILLAYILLSLLLNFRYTSSH